MKTRCLSICLTALLLTQSGSMPAFTALQEERKIRTASKSEAEFKAYMDLRRKSFQPTKRMLIAQGIPFDPALLIDENWRELLAPAFSRMPEMKKVIHGPALLQGIIIAHTLYLPSRVGLVGDTVIIARHLVFEGEEAIIRGPHNIAIFPIETYGLLGRVQASTRPTSDYRIFRSSFAPEPKERSLSKPTTIADGKLTIDVSGCGRKEWELT